MKTASSFSYTNALSLLASLQLNCHFVVITTLVNKGLRQSTHHHHQNHHCWKQHYLGALMLATKASSSLKSLSSKSWSRIAIMSRCTPAVQESAPRRGQPQALAPSHSSGFLHHNKFLVLLCMYFSFHTEQNTRFLTQHSYSFASYLWLEGRDLSCTNLLIKQICLDARTAWVLLTHIPTVWSNWLKILSLSKPKQMQTKYTNINSVDHDYMFSSITSSCRELLFLWSRGMGSDHLVNFISIAINTFVTMRVTIVNLLLSPLLISILPS